MRAVQVRVDAGDQFSGSGRRYDVIVRAGIESLNLERFIVCGGEDNQRQLLHCRLGAQQAAKRQAINFRQLEFKHYQVARLPIQQMQG